MMQMALQMDRLAAIGRIAMSWVSSRRFSTGARFTWRRLQSTEPAEIDEWPPARRLVDVSQIV
jgi:hypothetical protein